MRIAIVGSGGVGGYFGGRLAQAGESVIFVARGAHLAAIRDEGLRVESIAGDFVIRPAEAIEVAEGRVVDVVLVAVKAWQVAEIAALLGPFLGEETFVVPLENGVEAADRLEAAVGRGRVVGGLCKILSWVAAPGVIRHAGVTPQVAIGERDGSRSARVERLAQAFARAQGVSVSVPDDIEAAVWEKFLFIAPTSGVGAVARVPIGAWRDVAGTREMLESAMREIEEVARARGVRLAEDAVARTLAYVDSLPSEAMTSMQRDILEGRPSELEDQIGAIVRLGREAHVAVPVHAYLYASLLPQELRARKR
ncbi:MAG: 2-dehydropantoate 2-reductase [Polyangiaceae bacterium]|nr:2-dehydropantoate 2-reductase [Polyangiaceae bacterium]